MTKKVLLNGTKQITLNDKDYVSQGGEGTVYKQGRTAFKIYHNSASMIPEQKILELKGINISNVLGPNGVLYDPKNRKPIGFTMDFITDTEYLCKIFVKKFKKDHNITQKMIIELVNQMQETLIQLHQKQILVADYNEMNFLTDSKFKIPYHIDVDSYQTKNFHATAIMPSVRDRQLPFGKFNINSDWFSFAIVTFQLFTGIHPYKGRHPYYKQADLDGRMTDNVSVFNSEIRLPKSVDKFDSIIPRDFYQWYQSIFVDGDRTNPPITNGQITAGAIVHTIVPIIGTEKFIVQMLYDYKSDITNVYTYNNIRYVITDKNIYRNEKVVYDFTNKPKNLLLAEVLGSDPVVAVKQNDIVGFFSLDEDVIGKISADDFMLSNGNIYTMRNGKLYENYFQKIGKTKHMMKQVSNVVESSKMFTGVVIQDIFGKYNLTIPYENGKCVNIDVPELSGYRIIDAKREKRFCIIVAEQKGNLSRFVIYFSEKFNSYEIRQDKNIDYRNVNFFVKQNDMVATIKDLDTLELFYDIKKGSKEVKDCPIEISMNLYDGISKVLFSDGSKLYSVSMKG